MTENSARITPEIGQTGDAGKDAQDLVRVATKGALATVDAESGHPYASLVILATEPTGTPLFLISRLALHTRNLLADKRASLLVDASGPEANPLTGARVTLIGHVEPTHSPSARRRFLARHPEAEGYVDFPDFAFYALTIERAHFVGGFGRIQSLTPADLLVPVDDAHSLLDAEADIIQHMNEDHADAIADYATIHLGAEGQGWRMTGLDPIGCDIRNSARTLRLPFARRITTPADARQEFVRLAQLARSRTPPVKEPGSGAKQS